MYMHARFVYCVLYWRLFSNFMIKYSVHWGTVGNGDSLIISNKCQLWLDVIFCKVQPILISFSFSWSETWQLTFAIEQPLCLSGKDSETSLRAVSATRGYNLQLRVRLVITHWITVKITPSVKFVMLLMTHWFWLHVAWLCRLFFFYFSGVAVYRVMMMSVLIFSNIVKREMNILMLLWLWIMPLLCVISACKAVFFSLLFPVKCWTSAPQERSLVDCRLYVDWCGAVSKGCRTRYSNF